MVYYNNLLSLPICLPIAWLMGEFPAVLDAPLLHGPEANSFMLCALFSGVMGFVLNLASLWCNQSVTATVCITYMLYVICNACYMHMRMRCCCIMLRSLNPRSIIIAC